MFFVFRILVLLNYIYISKNFVLRKGIKENDDLLVQDGKNVTDIILCVENHSLKQFVTLVSS